MFKNIIHFIDTNGIIHDHPLKYIDINGIIHNKLSSPKKSKGKYFIFLFTPKTLLIFQTLNNIYPYIDIIDYSPKFKHMNEAINTIRNEMRDELDIVEEVYKLYVYIYILFFFYSKKKPFFSSR